ncbi:MAG: DNA polymerase/3'-5' exonuclease PolX [Planctomycetaceae bacterium]|nr:DNA polymerase/3'-5' exonuclease PolX [Planctomycetaceae bacterium]
MENSKIAERLEHLAALLEFQGASPFRLKAYRNGAETIRAAAASVASVFAQNQDLTTWPGIGTSVAEKCRELVETGSLKQIDDLEQEIPPSVLDLLRVPNLGPKKAATLFKELGVKDLEQLKVACEQQKVRSLKGFGVKTEQSILEGIRIAAQANQRMRISEADKMVRALREHFSAFRGLERFEFAGSYRRGKETVGDIDILAVTTDAAGLMDHFAKFENLGTVLVRGETKMSIRLDTGFQVDLRVVPSKSFGAALQYFTGSQNHNVELRHRAKTKQLKINEWGVFVIGSPAELANDPQLEGWVAGCEEPDVYAAVDLPWIDPRLREMRDEFAWADAGQLPKLVETKDIRGDLHMHTTASDGENSLEEMVAAARERGLDYIAITDHSQRVAVANGLNAERVLRQWEQIDKLNQQLAGQFTVLKSIECDILEDGRLDLPDEVLAQADWVMASIHFGIKQTRDEITRRILGAIEHPSVSAISHPTGRLINRREAYEVDIPAVIEHAAKHRKILELNASPKRLDLDDLHVRQARLAGVPIVISTDAHSTVQLDNLRFGVQQAQRGGLTAAHVINTQPWTEIRRWLRKS